MDAPVPRRRPQTGHQVVLIENDVFNTTSKSRGDVLGKVWISQTCCSTYKQTVDAELHIWTRHSEAGEGASVHGHGEVVELVGQLYRVPGQVSEMDALV